MNDGIKASNRSSQLALSLLGQYIRRIEELKLWSRNGEKDRVHGCPFILWETLRAMAESHARTLLGKNVASKAQNERIGPLLGKHTSQ